MTDTDVSDVPQLICALLIDDREMVLDAMRAALEAHEHIEVSAVASSRAGSDREIDSGRS